MAAWPARIAKLCRVSLAGTVKEAALGGAQIIQLREQGIDDRTLLARARDVRQLTRSCGVLLIVNDRPDIVIGIHSLRGNEFTKRSSYRI